MQTRTLKLGIILALSLAAVAIMVSLVTASQQARRSIGARPAVPLADHAYTSTLSSQIIPDGGCVTEDFATQSIDILDSFTVGRLRVGINLNHAWRNDLRIRLVAPDGTAAWLIFYPTYPPTLSQNLDVMMDDQSPYAVEGGGGNIDHDTYPPYYDFTWRPYQPLSPFTGKSSAGTWSLLTCDKVSYGTGVVRFFSLWMDEYRPNLSHSTLSSGKTMLAPGEDVTHSVLITNGGTAKAATASMVEELDPGLELLASGPTANAGNIMAHSGVVTWSGALLPGSGALVTIPVKVATCVTPLTSTATFSDPQAPAATHLVASSIEGFESGGIEADLVFPPTGWGVGVVAGATATWTVAMNGNHPDALPHSGAGMAQFNSYNAMGEHTARLYTRPLGFPIGFDPQLEFWVYHDTFGAEDRLQAQVSTDDGASYTNVGEPVFRANGSAAGWMLHTITLTHYAGASNVRIGFLGISGFGNNIYLDDILVRYVPTEARIEVQPVSPLFGQPVTFTGSTAGASNAYAKTWSFGDDSPMQTGDTVTHTFAISRIYDVTFSMCGYASLTSTQVTVSPSSGPINLILTSTSPTLIGTPTTFHATLLAGSLPITYTWNFGDGATQTGGQNATHTYTAAGSFTATVTAVNAMGSFVVTTPVAIDPLADLAVSISDRPDPVALGKSLTYTIVVNNNGPGAVNRIALTDTLPASPAVLFNRVEPAGQCGHSGGVVTCSLGGLSNGGVATVTVTVIPSRAGPATNSVQARGDAFDPALANNIATASTTISRAVAYFPGLFRRFPLFPAPPTLKAITNADGFGNYTVSWYTLTLANSYVLQEAKNVTFTNAVVNVYSGAGASWSVTGKPVGAYYYRVKALNAGVESAWSAPRVVHVTRSYDGYWRGMTTQNRVIEFGVRNNAIITLTYYYNAGGCQNLSQPFYGPPITIASKSFQLNQSGAAYMSAVTGAFQTDTSAYGQIMRLSYDLTCRETITPTWTATKR